MTISKFRAREKSSVLRGQGCCLCGEEAVTTIAGFRIGGECLKTLAEIAAASGIRLSEVLGLPYVTSGERVAS